MAEENRQYLLSQVFGDGRLLLTRLFGKGRIAWLRARHLRLGRYGEDIACRLLEEEGTEILCRNFRHNHQELDIVAREDDGTLCFVEVKTRRWREGVSPAEAVDEEKRRLLSLAARAYMRQIGWKQEHCRFDIIEVLVSASGNLMATNHIRGAFGIHTLMKYYR